MVGLPEGEQFEDVFSRFYTVHERVRHPDGRTDSAPWHRTV